MCYTYDPCGTGKKDSGSICKRQYGYARTWPRGYTFQYQVQGVLPGSDQATMEQAFEKAWQKWAQVTPYNFQKANNGSPNLIISVVGTNDNFFIQNPQTQAYANIGPEGNNPSHVRFKGPAFQRWTPEAIHTLFLHEFGHVLGLEHAQDRGAVMYPFINNMFSERPLTPNDIQRIRSLVGNLGPPTGSNNSNNNNQQNNNNNNQQQQNSNNNQQQNGNNNQQNSNNNQQQNNNNNQQNNNGQNSYQNYLNQMQQYYNNYYKNYYNNYYNNYNNRPQPQTYQNPGQPPAQPPAQNGNGNYNQQPPRTYQNGGYYRTGKRSDEGVKAKSSSPEKEEPKRHWKRN
ncbi:matrix metallopeptidase 13 [Orbilia ellipsospora]|uniref:Matrix metallopeptidase 13 n=1 Tax=Orbilia ellipsospora TaxID=2528407 RepID=A0AAV9XGH2_9PEZI